MESEEFINAVLLRPAHTGRTVEFETVITEVMAEHGLGELGAPITVRGLIGRVENGLTFGRGYARVSVYPTNLHHDGPLISTLGGHRTVRLLAED